jgi:hypothetical protein
MMNTLRYLLHRHHDLLVPSLLAAVVLILAVAISMGQQPPEDPFKDKRPHEIPHCDLPARAQRTGGAPCHCLKMVADIQQEAISECWDETELGMPPEGLDLPPQLYPESMKKCLKGKIPNHCEIISGTEHVSYLSNQCRTKCKPERCGCPDHTCRPHEEDQ